MWILESLGETPLRKPLLTLGFSQGAVFLLLAYFSINALHHPVTYAWLAVVLVLIYLPVHRWKTLLLPAIAAGSSAFFVPEYMMFYSVIFPFLMGKALFAETFRYWKWGVAATLFYASLLIVSRWQNIPWIYETLPPAVLPLLFGFLFGFCQCCTFLVFPLRRNPVVELVRNYEWKPGSEIHSLVLHTAELHEEICPFLDAKSKIEFQDFTVKLLQMCVQLQKIQLEIQKPVYQKLDKEIAGYEEKIHSVEDSVALRQYGQALENKKQQKKHYQSLTLHAERLQGRILHYVSALENMRFSYANGEFAGFLDTARGIDFFLHMAGTAAEQAAQKTEGYQKLMESE